MNATLSVIMPVYNASRYLKDTIESVLAQTWSDFEILIIDDGSTDNSLEIAHFYSQKDKRVKLFLQENQGVSIARNQGVQLTSGEFVAFIDADDQWLPNKLAAHLQHFNQNSNLGMSFAKTEFLTPDGQPTGKLSNSPLINLKTQHFLYENPTITVSNIVVRREVFQTIGYFDENMNYAEDLDWCLRVIASQKWKVEGINQVLTRYRTCETGLSSKLYCMEEGWQKLISKAKQYIPELVEQHYYRAQASHLRYLARRAFRLGLPSQLGVDFMNRALKSDWKIIFREPRRTILTMLAVYGQHSRNSLLLQLTK
jgi:glycosyltransferase involved in cell wall biosynthesis